MGYYRFRILFQSLKFRSAEIDASFWRVRIESTNKPRILNRSGNSPAAGDQDSKWAKTISSGMVNLEQRDKVLNFGTNAAIYHERVMVLFYRHNFWSSGIYWNLAVRRSKKDAKHNKMTKIINVTSNGLVRQVWNPSLRRRHGYTGCIWWRRAWKRESPRRWSATLNPEAGDCFTIREAKDQKCRMEFHHICDLPPGAGEGSPVPNHQSLYVERWREWRVLMVDESERCG